MYFFKYLQHIVPLFIFTIIFSDVKSQTPGLYTYQELSHLYYAKQNDSIKKNWICPKLYKEKETQKKYSEIWQDRLSFISNAINTKDFVYEKDIYNYLSQIVTDIITANPNTITKAPLILLDRSSSVNAYAIGGNILAVNLGLVEFASTREELALVIAHELSHNILNHADNSIKERAELLTSDEYKATLNSVLDSKYERLTRLKKALQGYSFSRSKHNRYHEADADSLAVVLLKNSKISFDAKYFLRLDSADIQYKKTLKNPVKTYFEKYSLSVEDWWTQKKSKGLSTKSYNFKDTASIQDSLKTHPECKERYIKNLLLSDGGKTTPIPQIIKDKTKKIIIWNMFDNQNLTACLYEILLEKDKGNTDVWYDFMFHNIFNGLYYSDKQLNRFNAINVKPKEYISKDYYELQNMLEQMPKENLEQFAKKLKEGSFWQGMPSDAKALKTLMNTIAFAEESSDKIENNAAKEFIANFPNSMYCEFADHFKKK
ncbi:MAG: M48 family metalloprotease [Bacteroidota bacterium]